MVAESRNWSSLTFSFTLQTFVFHFMTDWIWKSNGMYHDRTIPNDFTTSFFLRKNISWSFFFHFSPVTVLYAKKHRHQKEPLVVTYCNKLKHSRLNNVIIKLLFVVVQGSGSKYKYKYRKCCKCLQFFVVRLWCFVILCCSC